MALEFRMDTPKPEQVKAAREAAGHTQAQAAALVHTDGRTWRRWELGAGFESGRAMPIAHWELYIIKTGRAVRAAGAELMRLTQLRVAQLEGRDVSVHGRPARVSSIKLACAIGGNRAPVYVTVHFMDADGTAEVEADQVSI